jgi:hypothetical protein
MARHQWQQAMTKLCNYTGRENLNAFNDLLRGGFSTHPSSDGC